MNQVQKNNNRQNVLWAMHEGPTFHDSLNLCLSPHSWATSASMLQRARNRDRHSVPIVMLPAWGRLSRFSTGSSAGPAPSASHFLHGGLDAKGSQQALSCQTVWSGSGSSVNKYGPMPWPYVWLGHAVFVRTCGLCIRSWCSKAHCCHGEAPMQDKAAQGVAMIPRAMFSVASVVPTAALALCCRLLARKKKQPPPQAASPFRYKLGHGHVHPCLSHPSAASSSTVSGCPG